jgi:hypothetical protein
MMLVGRIISGFAIGMMSVGVPVYLAECAYRKITNFLQLHFERRALWLVADILVA